MGLIFQEKLNDYERALRKYGESIEIIKKVWSDDHFPLIQVFTNCATCHLFLGKSFEAPTLEGTQKISVEPGSQPNTIIKLKGKGLPGGGFRGRGDQYVRLVVNIPKKLNKEQKNMLKDFQDSFN